MLLFASIGGMLGWLVFVVPAQWVSDPDFPNAPNYVPLLGYPAILLAVGTMTALLAWLTRPGTWWSVTAVLVGAAQIIGWVPMTQPDVLMVDLLDADGNLMGYPVETEPSWGLALLLLGSACLIFAGIQSWSSRRLTG
ncbi:MAG: hypothetical protein ACK5KO_07275 [Arachnia sp.]